MKNNKGDLFMKLSKNASELLGIMFGDGCLSSVSNRNVIYISGHKIDDYNFHDIVTRKLFRIVFNREIDINFRKDENTLFIRFSDKHIFDEFRYLGMPVGKKYPNLIIPVAIKSDRDLMFAFLRGLMATDGCVVFSKQHRDYAYYPRIELTSKSKNFLAGIYGFLKQNDFYGSLSNKGRGYRLEFPGIKNLHNWIQKIGLSNNKHMNKIQAHLGPERPEPDSNW